MNILKNCKLFFLTFCIFLIVSCRPAPSSSEAQGINAQNISDGISAIAKSLLGFLGDRVLNLQKLAYSGNAFASDEEFEKDIQGARNILFQPWYIPFTSIQIPQWQGIYFFAGKDGIHVPTSKNINSTMNNLIKNPFLKSMLERFKIDIALFIKIFIANIDKLPSTDRASIIAAIQTGEIEFLPFVGVDRGESAEGNGDIYWGFILAAEGSTEFIGGGIGHEFIFKGNDLSSLKHENVVFGGLKTKTTGAGTYIAWDSTNHKEVGFYLDLPGTPLGMFATLNSESLPGPIRDWLLAGAHFENDDLSKNSFLKKEPRTCNITPESPDKFYNPHSDYLFTEPSIANKEKIKNYILSKNSNLNKTELSAVINAYETQLNAEAEFAGYGKNGGGIESIPIGLKTLPLDLVIANMLLETNFMTDLNNFNYGKIRQFQSTIENSYQSMADGVQAHIILISTYTNCKEYTDPSNPKAIEALFPRYRFVTRGIESTVRGYSSRRDSNPQYAEKFIQILKEMRGN